MNSVLFIALCLGVQLTVVTGSPLSRTSTTTTATCQLDVLFIIDGSESIIEEDFTDALIPFLINVSNTLESDPDVDVRFGAMEFSSDVTLITDNFNSTQPEFTQALQNHVQSAGTTLISSALRVAQDFKQVSASPDRVPVYVLVSDGVSSDRANLSPAIEIFNNQASHRVILSTADPNDIDPRATEDNSAIVGRFGIVDPVDLFRGPFCIIEAANMIKAGCGM